MNTLATPWEAPSTNAYDAFVAAVGFETRANHIAKFFDPEAKLRLAWAFSDRHEISFKANWDWYCDRGYTMSVLSDREFATSCRNLFHELGAATSSVSVLVDVSSLSRFRIATIVDFARRTPWKVQARIDFAYCIGAYSEPSLQFVPNRHVEPVLPSFAGWSPEPGEPPLAVVGLGYEQDKALGAVEHVQAARIWAFFPESSEFAYIDALTTANATFLELIPGKRVLRYDVHRPFDCFVRLEQIVYQGLQRSGVILFPFGPKIFSVVCMGVACVHPQAAVWRVSPGVDEPASDRMPTDQFTGLSIQFEPL